MEWCPCNARTSWGAAPLPPEYELVYERYTPWIPICAEQCLVHFALTAVALNWTFGGFLQLRTTSRCALCRSKTRRLQHIRAPRQTLHSQTASFFTRASRLTSTSTHLKFRQYETKLDSLGRDARYKTDGSVSTDNPRDITGCCRGPKLRQNALAVSLTKTLRPFVQFCPTKTSIIA